MKTLQNQILSLSDAIRYVAVYTEGNLSTTSRQDIQNSSDPESDKYEELIVNPTVITLLTQRGNIDCGGFKYALIRYGYFYVFIIPYEKGHITVGIESNANPMEIIELVKEGLKNSESYN